MQEEYAWDLMHGTSWAWQPYLFSWCLQRCLRPQRTQEAQSPPPYRAYDEEKAFNSPGQPAEAALKRSLTEPLLLYTGQWTVDMLHPPSPATSLWFLAYANHTWHLCPSCPPFPAASASDIWHGWDWHVELDGMQMSEKRLCGGLHRRAPACLLFTLCTNPCRL
eukprot:365738-Chlamydomonas_euryale.AAC.29